MRILLLSDTHLVADGGRPREALVALLHDLRYVAALDLVVVGGDCSDDGSPAAYTDLRALVEPWAEARGARVVYAMGNHDQRAGFAAVLGDGVGGAADGAVPLGGTTEVAGMRVVVLDSSVPGRTHGLLDAGQADSLRALLAAPSPAGAVVVIHHPPVPSATPLHAGIELQNPRDLADALRGADVRLILSGHYHHFLADALQSERLIPVVVAPGVVNANDVVAAPGHERATAGRGACLIELTDRGPRVEVIATSSEQVLSDLDPDEVATVAARINA